MNTKHTLICIQGNNLGEIAEIELNREPKECFGGAFYVKGGKLVFAKKYEKENKSWIQRILSRIFQDNKVPDFHLGDHVFTALNDQFRTSQGDVYQLLRSDLYKTDFNGYTQFQGIKGLYLAEPEKDAIGKIKNQLTQFQAETMSKISGTIEKYVTEYIKDPIAVIEKQNNLLREMWNEKMNVCVETKDAGENDVVLGEARPVADKFESMILLNALVEKELVNRTEKDREKTAEIKSTEYLAEGDYSPTHGVKPGERIDEIGRGNLRLSKTEDKNFLKLLAEAKIDATRPGTNKFLAAMKVYRRILKQFEGKYQRIGRAEMTVPLHDYLNKGSCIDQALILQLALQEAGIRSRFVRGKFLNTMDRHAWVEADVLEPGKYALIFDPARNAVTSKCDRFAKYAYRYEADEGKKLDYFNVIWRTK